MTMERTQLGNTLRQWLKNTAIGLPVVGLCLTLPVNVQPALAGLSFGPLSLSSDFRFRYEFDDANDRDTNRDRTRIRYRFGLQYQLSENVEFGSRLRTNSSSIQSPHQTLGQLEDPSIGSQRLNRDFGLDRAYIKFKVGENGFLWMGKNKVALWQQTEQFWVADFQGEGAAAGNTFNIGTNASFTLQGGYYYLNDTGFDLGIGQDDAIIPVQGVYRQNFGTHDMVLAWTNEALIDSSGLIPGDEEFHNRISGQWNMKSSPMPFTLGYETFFSDINDIGFVATARTRLDPWTKKIRLRLDWSHVPLNSVAAQGMLAQDDSRFSSNFHGAMIRLDYDVMKHYNIVFRIFPQDTLEEGLTTDEVPGLGNYVQRTHDTTRFQIDFNIKF